jgi:GT2 family glycosyltransferase
LACDPAVHLQLDIPKIHDVCFIAHMNTHQRAHVAGMIAERYKNSLVGQRYFREMAEAYSASRIGVNLSVANDINMRTFEVLACGSMLLTNFIENNGLDQLFDTEKQLVEYRGEDDFFKKIHHYLSHEDERMAIAKAGREHAIHNHTYAHRMAALLDCVIDRSGFHRSLRGRKKGLTSVVIPVWNQLKYTQRCIESIRIHTPEPYELIVVDNGSTDGTANWVQQTKDIRLIQNAENLGFSAAVNQGVAASCGEQVLILNNDTIVTSGYLEKMLHVLNSSERIGLVGPCSNDVPGPQRVDTPLGSLGELESFARRHAERQSESLVFVKVLGGFCLLIRKSVFERVGTFCEEFGIGTYDDYDFCTRALSAGYQLAIAQRAYVHHFGSRTLHASGIDIGALLKRNESLFQSRCKALELGPATEAFRLPLVSIVIVTFNAIEMTKMCLRSIRGNTSEPYEIIVVDNGSTDGTAQELKHLSSVRLIENPLNLGFPVASNQGIASSIGHEILLLNNDVIVTAGWLTRLRKVLRSSNAIGLVGPYSNAVSGNQQVAVDYRELKDLGPFAERWARDHADDEMAKTDRLIGFCLLFRHELVERIGLLDERFGLGNYEDDDFCKRARMAGFELAIARQCFVHHFGSASFRLNGVDHAALLKRNGELFAEKWALDRPSMLNIGENQDKTWAESEKSRLSLCMIVRNSSRTLRQCLSSIRPWVDEMIVVDTGSTDDTVRIAEELGAQVHLFEWSDSFAAARNESLRFATGQWIFWMDSDDTIDQANGAKLRQLLAREYKSSTLGFVMQVRCPTGSSAGPYATATVVDHVKMFRNLPAIRFTGRIHEQVLPAIRRLGGDVEWTDACVVHSGSDTSAEGKAKKHQRDIRLLELEVSDNPDDTFALFNMGMTLMDMGQPDQTVNWLCRSLQLASPGDSHLRKIYALLVQAYASLGRHKTALHTCLQGLAVCPNDPELLFRKGVLQFGFGMLESAEQAFNTVICGTADRHFSSIDHGINGIKAWHNLALIYEQSGRLDEAAKAWQQVIRFDPSNLVAWSGYVDVICHKGDWQELERVGTPTYPDVIPSSVITLVNSRLETMRLLNPPSRAAEMPSGRSSR